MQLKPSRSLGVVAAVIVTLAACSSDGSPHRAASGATSSTGATTTTTEPTSRPDGPAADVGAPLSGGRGIFLGAAGAGPDLAEAGYVEAEYAVSGTATSYSAPDGLPTDGTFRLSTDGSAAYTTRIVVRRPKAARDFDGTVVVEWLNVSGGVDAAPDYTYLADEILRRGEAWVGVSAQRIGVEGGTVAVKAPGAELQGAGKGLRAIDPARYGSLHHPGDSFSYDIFTQVGRALRRSGRDGPLGGLHAARLLAVGESQSAFTMTTYVDGVQPLTHEFDGFLIHSRGGAPAPVSAPGGSIDIAGSIGGRPTRIRTDLDVPTIVVETETDVAGVLGYLPARQPDGERFRLWEVAGTAHADAFQVGAYETRMDCGTPINRGQQRFVLRAALRDLDRWAGGGAAPPTAPRLDVDSTGAGPRFRLDEVGNVTGGVRTPAVDAPVDVLSGLAPSDSSVICILLGSTTPIPDDVLARRYPDRDAYLAAYRRATDAAIRAGFVLRDDRDQVLADAQPDRFAA
jgi:hypothetical protein